jgi:DNA-binding CsgD family transcriptional regulator
VLSRKPCLQQALLDVAHSQSPEDLKRRVVTFAHEIGFELASAMVVVDRLNGAPKFANLENMPRGFADTFHDRDQQLRDPVLQHCKKSSLPIFWDERTYRDADQGHVWEEQARFGLRTGICLAIHLPSGRHFALGFDRETPLPQAPDAVARLAGDCQLFAVYAQEAAFRIHAAELDSERPEKPLSAREMEVLRLTMDGKTAWDVSRILAISERTVVMHLQNAMKKLDCVNKHHAALTAYRLGLID